MKVADRTWAGTPPSESAARDQEVSRTELEALAEEAQWLLAVRELEQFCLSQRLSSPLE